MWIRSAKRWGWNGRRRRYVSAPRPAAVAAAGSGSPQGGLPAGGGKGRVGVEATGGKYPFGRDRAEVGVDDIGPGIERLQHGAHAHQRFAIHLVGMIEHDYVAAFDLVDEHIDHGAVIVVGLGQRAIRQEIGIVPVLRQACRVDHCHQRVEPQRQRGVRVLEGEQFGQRNRFGGGHGLHDGGIVLAAAGQFGEPVQQVRTVDERRHAPATRVGKHMIQQRGLAGTGKAGEHGNGQAFGHGGGR